MSANDVRHSAGLGPGPTGGDEALVGLLVEGDARAFAELVDRYHGRLIRLASTVVGRRELAEEVAQETWVAVVRGVERFDGRATLRTWLFRICVNRARSTVAKETRITAVDTSGPAVDPSRFTTAGVWSSPPDDWTDAVDDRMVAAGLIGAARHAIDALPVNQRQVVTLRDVEGLSSADVCEVLSISSANERVLLHRGRSRIRAALEARTRDGE